MNQLTLFGICLRCTTYLLYYRSRLTYICAVIPRIA